MTAATARTNPVGSATRGRPKRPVARFVLVAMALCAVLIGVRWTGAVNPWAVADGVGSTGSPNAPTSADPTINHASTFLLNQGLLAVEVRSVTVEGIDATVVGSPIGAGRLAPGEAREVIVAFRAPYGVRTGTPRIQAEVVSALGRARTVEADLAVGGW